MAIALVGEHMQHGRIRLRSLFVDSYQSLASSLFGAAVTIVFVDSFVRRGDRVRRTAELISILRGGSEEASAVAVEHLRMSGWLMDGTMASSNMSRATLLGADLESAVLDDADLTHARLAGASLFGARLCRANLSAADLQGANLTLADLREANLFRADLRGAELDGADLRGAVLRDCLVDADALTRAITESRTPTT
ncbi:pentapeptide repeat-containing protein [Streptomyces sp. JL3001]|uniref:pentapeptide repeat-containing protein n=1 Tax=Streptomyces sp. JL3001 TaxID=3400923 RepID=UPI003B28C705